ncbi:tRNA lysidine(34) synthetase TilS [Sporosarcina sp. G11-34]|uniref:tRNA lysidine(34) synthetase TilS n=1 Tax=Sporosarcina sp. G11-34 TaxID=2849605 RepID=UPI0022A8EDB0|nr:tRNA lysidine(34) synthetase TilS [Sporosarcina sp. G11-34]MCZ2260586.1 tRNA lysidine(34) synthetase TilS [Sporosarcina sp. G11-34]
MDNFDEKIFQYIKEKSLVKKGDRILIACSGGVDSVALLHFVAINREKLGVEVAAVHVDHMLRGIESEEDGTFVESVCKTYGIPFFGGSVPVPEIIKKDGGNVQAICREGRYVFFQKTMREQQFNVLATAHHAEDQLETVLMQLTKGGIPTGIPIKRMIENGILIRPFLPAMKDALYSYARRHELKFREDPSNNSNAYMRNRFRQEIVPFILKENPTAAENAVTLSSKVQEDEEFLGSMAKARLEKIVDFTDEGLPFVDSRAFMDMPTALQRRMIPLLLGYLYNNKNLPVEYKSGLIGQLLKHLGSQEGNVSIDLPFGYQFLREYGNITFVQKKTSPESNVQKTVPKGKQFFWGNDVWFYWSEVENVDVDLLTNAKEVMYFDLPEPALPLQVRRRNDGDRILLPGMVHSKRLSRLFIDEKVSKSKRLCLPIVVTAQDEVCAVPGLRYGAAFTRNRTAAGKYIFLRGEI